MEDVVWTAVTRLIDLLPNTAPARAAYRSGLMLRVGLWAILHDRPFRWACRPESWPPAFRPRFLPHPSTLSRRWRSAEITRLLRDLHRLTVGCWGPLGRFAAIDGRPLLVGGSSKDPDALAGRAVGGMGRGYKLHAMICEGGLIVCFEVHALNVAEQTIAKRLLTMAPRELTRVVGDKIYDSVRVHRAARAKGRRLYTPLREGRVGKRQQPERLRVLRVISTGVGKRLLRWRDGIERAFARMSNVGFGLKGLPAWVRRRHRATAWISGKIVFYNAYLLLRRHAEGV